MLVLQIPTVLKKFSQKVNQIKFYNCPLGSKNPPSGFCFSRYQNFCLGCSAHIFGSSVIGFGLKSSDINLDLKTSGPLLPCQALLKAIQVINKADELT